MNVDNINSYATTTAIKIDQLNFRSKLHTEMRLFIAAVL